MDKLTEYKQVVRQLLSRYSQGYALDDDIETQLLFDDEHSHYQWMDVGWQGSKRVYQSIMHFDIQDEKIWLQQNLTEQNPAEDLVNMGIPREDIVLGLQPPFKRPYTDYGMA